MARFLTTIFQLHDIFVAEMTNQTNVSENDNELELLTVRTTAELVLGTLTYIVIIFMSVFLIGRSLCPTVI